MKLIRLGLGEKTVDERVAQGNAIKTALPASGFFVSPNPTMLAFGTVITNLSTAKITRDNAIEAGKAATVSLRAAKLAYDASVTQLALYAENVAAGDAAKLEDAGFELRSKPTPTTEPGQVKGLDVVTNGYPGRFLVNWETLPGASVFEVQTSAEPVTEESWRSQLPTTATKSKIEGLPSGQRIAVRVRGVVSDLAGQWSEPITKVVP